jgi:hypothetical protein
MADIRTGYRSATVMKERIKRVSYEAWTGAALAILTVLAIGTLLDAVFSMQVVA